MSGGHFDYNCFRISQFADDLEHEIENNDVKNDYGYEEGLHDATLEVLTKIQRVIELSGKLAKEAEWLYSGDIGENGFVTSINKIFVEAGITI